MQVTAIIAAGGRGARFGGDRLKQLMPLGRRSILERSVAAFLDHPSVDEVVVALPQALVDDPPEYLHSAKLRLVAGGERRQDSVANAFRAAAAASDIIVIHDAARPFASADLIARTIAAAAESGAAVAAVQSRDTVKQVGSKGSKGSRGSRGSKGSKGSQGSRGSRGSGGSVERFVEATIARETIYLAQTPQAFRRDVLRDALALGVDATDEASLAERAGHTVRIVEGETTNIKITTREDLELAEAIEASLRSAERGARNPDASPIQSTIHNPQSAISSSAPARTGRAGLGYDIHRLVEGRPLILGGVTIPFERGLIGHSDADAVCHAITEAILGAAAAGDIGRHFPDADPRWQGASSIDLLRRAAAIVRERGLEVGNVDASVIAERPKLLPYIEAMRANVAEALGVSIDRVSLKGKTNEGLGEIGRGEAIAVHAIALVRSCA